MSSPAGGAAGSAGGDAGPAVNSSGQGDGDGGQVFDASAAFGELKAGQAQQEALLRQLAEGRDPRSEADDADDGDGFDLSGYDDLDAGEYDGDPQDVVDLDQLAARFGDDAAQAAAAAVAPVRGEVEAMRQEAQDLRDEAAWRDCVAEFPELGDREVQGQIFGLAEQLVHGGAIPGESAFKPQMIRVLFLAHRALMLRDAEERAEPAPDAGVLEGGGANPGGSGLDLGDQIVSATDGGLGKNVLDFH